VAGHPPGAGPRRDGPGAAVCGVGGQRGRSRRCQSRGLGRVARPHQPCLAARMVAAAAPPAAGHPPPLAGQRPGGAGLGGAVAVAADRPVGRAPVCAQPSGRALVACWPALRAPLAALCAPARATGAGPGHSLAASRAATGVDPVGLVGGRRAGSRVAPAGSAAGGPGGGLGGAARLDRPGLENDPAGRVAVAPHAEAPS